MKKQWHILVLLILAIPFVLSNIYFNIFIFLQNLSRADYPAAGADFYGVYLRTAKYFLEDPAKLYYIAPGAGMDWFIYPPPSIFLLLPFGILPDPYNLIFFKLGIVVCIVFAIVLSYKFITTELNIKYDKYNIYLLVFLSFALASSYKTLLLGQIDSYVLLIPLIGYYFIKKGKPILGVVMMIFSGWVKLYTLVVLPLFAFSQKKKALIIGIIIGLIALPLSISWIIPLKQYGFYFLDLMPKFVKLPQDVSPLNQNFMNFVMHFFLPASTLGHYIKVEFPSWLQLTNIIVFLSFLVVIYYYNFKTKSKYEFLCFSSVFVITPIFSVTGWESVYIFSIPLLIYTLVVSDSATTIVKLIIIGCMFLLMIPKPPSNLILQYVDKIPLIVQILFYIKNPILIFTLISLSFKLVNDGGFKLRLN